MPVVFRAEQDGIACLNRGRRFCRGSRNRLVRAMSRSRCGRRGAARLRSGRATPLLGMLALAACSSAEPEVPPARSLSCGAVAGRRRAHVRVSRRAPRRAPDELRYIAVLTDLSSACRYYSGPTDGTGVDVDLSASTSSPSAVRPWSAPRRSPISLRPLVPTAGSPGQGGAQRRPQLRGGAGTGWWSEDLTLRLPRSPVTWWAPATRCMSAFSWTRRGWRAVRQSAAALGRAQPFLTAARRRGYCQADIAS